SGHAIGATQMPPQSVWRVIAYLKAYCEDDGDLVIDEAELYRRPCELLTGQSPLPAPVKINEECIQFLIDLKEGPETEIRAAADWAFVFYRDLYGEDPPDGDVDAYMALTVKVLMVRHLMPLSRGTRRASLPPSRHCS